MARISKADTLINKINSMKNNIHTENKRAQIIARIVMHF
jgi:hypothetical protein